MSRTGRGIAAGLILILVGIGLLAVKFMPGLEAWVSANLAWPLYLVGAGLLLLLLGALTGAAGLAVPACILLGLGGVFYWQLLTHQWETWAYVWTLIPGFTGIGVILAGLMEGNRSAVRGGLIVVLVSVVLFGIFGSFLGGRQDLAKYWPAAIIALGLYLLIGPLLARRRR